MTTASRTATNAASRRPIRSATQEAMKLVRADLATRLDALEQTLARRGPLGAVVQATAIAGVAADFDLASVQRLAEGLMAALGQGARGAAIDPWIAQLRDAIGCETQDARDEASWLASVMVRLAG